MGTAARQQIILKVAELHQAIEEAAEQCESLDTDTLMQGVTLIGVAESLILKATQ